MERARLQQLPGSEIVLAGIDDLAAGIDSLDARAAAVASRRLRRAGLEVPQARGGPPAAHRLYEAVAEAHPAGSHSRYNAILGRVAAFARAIDRASSGR